MKEYIRYEIAVRPYSANVIKGIYLYTNENKKQVEKSEIILMSGLPKKEGDILINKVFETLYKQP